MQHDLEKWELWKRICCGFPLAFLLKIDYNTIRLFIESFIIGRAKHLFGHVAGGSCAAGRCEPCQAGNRAALSGMFHVPRGRRFRSCMRRTFFAGGDFLYQALYRKWRPRTFDDVVGQSHITDTLKRQAGHRPAEPRLPVYRHPGERARPPAPRSCPGGEL